MPLKKGVFVLTDPADLDEVIGQVANNCRAGKVKPNSKKLRQRGHKFKDNVDEMMTTAARL